MHVQVWPLESGPTSLPHFDWGQGTWLRHATGSQQKVVGGPGRGGPQSTIQRFQTFVAAYLFPLELAAAKAVVGYVVVVAMCRIDVTSAHTHEGL